MAERLKTVGVVGLFDDPQTLLAAAAAVRDEGYERWDCHTPYPVHGLDRAMNNPPSPIPAIGLAAGLIGAVAGMLMQWWTSVVDYPILIGGKPLFSWPAFVPITFELFVLFAALATMAGMIGFCRLGRWRSPLHDSNVMAEVTGARFAIVLDARDKRFSEIAARRLLEKSGCRDVRPLHETQQEDRSII